MTNGQGSTLFDFFIAAIGQAVLRAQIHSIVKKPIVNTRHMAFSGNLRLLNKKRQAIAMDPVPLA
jgi:hypothetical protein